jgi:Peptidase family M41/ATPase family associated with various cellular activities (AAA)
MDPNLPKNHPKNLATAMSQSKPQRSSEPAVTREEVARFLIDLAVPRVRELRTSLRRPGVLVLENRFDGFYAELRAALSAALASDPDVMVEVLFREETKPPYQTGVFTVETLNQGRSIVWLLPSAKDIRGLVPTIDGVIRIPPLNARLLSQACQAFYALEKAPAVEEGGWIGQVGPNDFLINSAVSGDPIPHIRGSVEARLRDFDCADALPLQSLDGLAEAREWAQDLVEDVHAVAAGKLTWQDIERGAILAGRPGAGKSTLARGVARELGWRLVRTSAYSWAAAAEKQPSEAARAMESAFRITRLLAPCVLLVEDVHYLPPLASLFQEEILDYSAEAPFLVIGTTTVAPGDISDAMLRTCHFERVIAVPMPSAAVLSELFRQRAARLNHTISEEQFKQLGRLAFGRTGTDVEFFVKRAQRIARRDGGRAIRFDDVVDAFFDMPTEAARTKVGEEEMRNTAYHEAGHAVMRYLLADGGRDIHYVTVVPRSGAAGFLYAHHHKPPDASFTERDHRALIRVALAGRAAEELLLGPDGISTGSGGSDESDLGHATHRAVVMITRYGFNQGRRLALRLGNINDDPELRREVETLLAEEYQSTLTSLREHWNLVQALAERLVTKQELTGDEVRALLASVQEAASRQAA